MPFRVEQTSFVTGEIAGELFARRDTQQYASALARARNITAIPQGGFMRREGTAYVATLFAGKGGPTGAAVRILPFEFSKTETYLITLRQNTIEVRDYTGAVLKTFSAIAGDPVFPETALPDLNYVQALDTMFLVHPEYEMRVLQRFDTTDWRLKLFEWVLEEEDADDVGTNQPWHKFADGDVTLKLNNTVVPATGVTATASEGHFQGLHLTTRIRAQHRTDITQYIEAEISALPSVTLSGTATFTNGSTAVSGSLTKFTGEVYPGDLIYKDAQTVGSAGSLTREAAVVATVTDDQNLVLAEPWTGTNTPGTPSIVSTGTAASLTGTITISGTAVTGTSTAFRSEVNVGDRIYIDADTQKKATKVASVDSDTALTLDRAYVGSAGPAGGSVVTKQGTTTATVNNRVKVGTPSAGKAKTTWVEAAMSPLRGYTRAITLHQNRLVICGTRDLPDTCFFSKSGLYFTYDEGKALADEAFSLTMTSKQINDIQQAVSQSDLIVGTLSQSFVEEHVPIKPDNAGVAAGPNIGWANIVPVSLEGAVVYVSDGRGSIRQRIVELVYDDAVQSYVATDISILAFHLINSPTRMGMRNGDSQTTADNVFVVNSGMNAHEGITRPGALAVLNTIRSQQITGWTLWETAGDFLDVAVIANVVWFAVNRTINGADSVYLERLDPNTVTDASFETTVGTALTGTLTFTSDPENEPEIVTGLSTNFLTELAVGDTIMFDADGVVYRSVVAVILSEQILVLQEAYQGPGGSGTATKLATTVSGLSHLESETVDLVADGEYLGQYVVSSGAITPERPVSVVEAGLPYSWSAVTLPRDAETQAGATTNTMRRVVHADVSVLRATELRLRHYGDAGPGTRVEFGAADVTPFGSPPAPFTGTKRVHLLGHDRTGQLELFGTEPRATHVRGITWEVA